MQAYDPKYPTVFTSERTVSFEYEGHPALVVKPTKVDDPRAAEMALTGDEKKSILSVRAEEEFRNLVDKLARQRNLAADDFACLDGNSERHRLMIASARTVAFFKSVMDTVKTHNTHTVPFVRVLQELERQWTERKISFDVRSSDTYRARRT